MNKQEFEQYVNKIKDKLGPEKEEVIDQIMSDLAEVYIGSLTISAANYHFCRLVSKPVGVNDEEQPDYDELAKEALELALETTPHLLKALGISNEEELF